jgi:hypothetical protein
MRPTDAHAQLAWLSPDPSSLLPHMHAPTTAPPNRNSIPAPAPCVSYSGTFSGVTLHVVWTGRDAEHKVDLVGTVPASLATYLALQAWPETDLVISAGTAGGFKAKVCGRWGNGGSSACRVALTSGCRRGRACTAACISKPTCKRAPCKTTPTMRPMRPTGRRHRRRLRLHRQVPPRPPHPPPRLRQVRPRLPGLAPHPRHAGRARPQAGRGH